MEELKGEKKLKVFYFAPENTGVAYYRFWQPLEDLQQKGLIEVRNHGFDFTGKNFEFPTLAQIKEIGEWADIFIFGRMDSPQYFGVIQTIKTYTGKPILLDIDDNIFSISPYVAAALVYNVNGQSIKLHQEMARYVDGVIVSTEALAEIYKKFNQVWIIKNGIRYLYTKKQHEGVNIGYLCSGSHLENAQIIEAAVIRTLRKHKNVNFYYTKAFQGFLECVPEDIKMQVNYLPFFPLKDYLQYANNLNLDIGLAPLMTNDFNRCKSNIRVLEYWQNRTAVIASPLDEYQKTITHGYDGYLSQDDEWEHWMDDLITHPERREYLVKNSTLTLKKYDVAQEAQKYLALFRELLKR